MTKEELKVIFEEKFGGEGDIRTYFAPGRVNLIGEHTDYNGGHVFPCALTIGTYAVARKREDKVIKLYSKAPLTSLQIKMLITGQTIHLV